MPSFIAYGRYSCHIDIIVYTIVIRGKFKLNYFGTTGLAYQNIVSGTFNDRGRRHVTKMLYYIKYI